MPTPQPSIGAEKSTLQGQVESLLRTNTVAYQTNRATIEKEGIKLFAMTRLRLSAALIITSALAALLALVAFSPTAQAHHSWGKYHWARTSNPFTLELGNNVTSGWSSYLSTASSRWSESSVLNTTVVSGRTTGAACNPTSGRVEVCNAAYGENGWLGLAQIWIYRPHHIYQGTTKVNDTYFNRAAYNTAAWKQFVMCQEVGHTFGLDHQDENFYNTNLGTCMDYTNDPDGTLADPDQLSNLNPNLHNYEQLETIYSHLDSFTTVAPASAASTKCQADNRGSFNSRAQWGRLVEQSPNGKLEVWERSFGGEARLITWVIRP